MECDVRSGGSNLRTCFSPAGIIRHNKIPKTRAHARNTQTCGHVRSHKSLEPTPTPPRSTTFKHTRQHIRHITHFRSQISLTTDLGVAALPAREDGKKRGFTRNRPFEGFTLQVSNLPLRSDWYFFRVTRPLSAVHSLCPAVYEFEDYHIERREAVQVHPRLELITYHIPYTAVVLIVQSSLPIGFLEKYLYMRFH